MSIISEGYYRFLTLTYGCIYYFGKNSDTGFATNKEGLKVYRRLEPKSLHVWDATQVSSMLLSIPDNN